VKPNDLILRCLAQQGLEGRSSIRHPSFEASFRFAPQDEVEKTNTVVRWHFFAQPTDH